MPTDGTYTQYRPSPPGLFAAWMKYYRAFGLAEMRAQHCASKKCAKGKFPAHLHGAHGTATPD